MKDIVMMEVCRTSMTWQLTRSPLVQHRCVGAPYSRRYRRTDRPCGTWRVIHQAVVSCRCCVPERTHCMCADRNRGEENVCTFLCSQAVRDVKLRVFCLLGERRSTGGHSEVTRQDVGFAIARVAGRALAASGKPHLESLHLHTHVPASSLLDSVTRGR